MRLPPLVPLNFLKWAVSMALSIAIVTFLTKQPFGLVFLIFFGITFFILNVIFNFLLKRLRASVNKLLPTATIEIEGEILTFKYIRQSKKRNRISITNSGPFATGVPDEWFLQLKITSAMFDYVDEPSLGLLKNVYFPQEPLPGEISIPAILTISDIQIPITLLKSPVACPHSNPHWTGTKYICTQDVVRVGNTNTIAVVTFIATRVEKGTAKGCLY